MASSHLLDNLVWHSLTGVHAHLAIGTRLAKRYPPDVFIAVALADHSDAACAELARLVPADEVVGLVGVHLPDQLPGWQTHDIFMADQMVCQEDISGHFSTDGIIALTAADVPDMLRLVDVVQPGPFFSRTIEMGRFFGIRQDGELVAMAGERFQPPGYCEICTVCTHPDWRGKGYARQLCSHLVYDNWQKGVTPFLTVDPENTLAIGLYERMHFTRRTAIKILIMSHA